MLNHEHCIRIVDVHENVPFSGTWCESCACSQFKRPNPNGREASTPTGAAAAVVGTPPSAKSFIPISSSTSCAICGHSASEHSGVMYNQMFGATDDRMRYRSGSGGAAMDGPEIIEEEGETRQV